MLTPFEQYLLQQQLKMQTTVNTSQAPGQSGMSSGAGAPLPTAAPVPASGGGGAAGTGGGGVVNTQGGNISQGAIYGGSVTNTASGGTGSLDASGGSNNVYRETSAAPAATPPPGGAIPADAPGAECGMETPCPDGKFCKMGVCEPIPEGGGHPYPEDNPGDMSMLTGSAPTFSQFLRSRGAM